MKSPKFSIIIPVYNVAPYLRECLDSVLAQTYTDWEVICVDDGSTDGSGAILDEYVRELENRVGVEDRRIKVIHQQNQGVSAARNAALDVAQGEWVLFADADDALVDITLSKLEEIVTKNPDADMVQYSYQDVCNQCDSVMQPKIIRFDYLDLMDEREACERFPEYILCSWAWNACYNRRVIGETRFKPFKANEDTLFAVSCLVKAKQLVRTNLRLYKYLQRSDSAVHKTSLKLVEDDLVASLQIFEEIKKFRFFNKVSASAYRIVRSSLIHHYLRYSGLLPSECFAKGRELFYELTYHFLIKENNAAILGRIVAYICFLTKSNWMLVCIYVRYLNFQNRIIRKLPRWYTNRKGVL